MAATELNGSSYLQGIRSNSTDTETFGSIFENSVPFTAFIVTLYTILFLVGVSGNSLVIYVIVRNKAMKTITNTFIANLAISDTMMCLLAVPFTPLSYLMNSWIFGEVLCHIVPMSLCICVYVSILTSAAIAVDRYIGIVYPFKPRMKKSMCLLVIVVIWVIAILLSLPLGVSHRLDAGRQWCVENWSSEQFRKAFTVISLVLQYVIPCGVITFCYVRVSLVLNKQAEWRLNSGQVSQENEAIELRRKQKTIRMLVAMVTIFVICWLPFQSLVILRDYDDTSIAHPYWPLFYFLGHIVAMVSAVYNPFLYALMNDKFREQFKRVLPIGN